MRSAGGLRRPMGRAQEAEKGLTPSTPCDERPITPCALTVCVGRCAPSACFPPLRAPQPRKDKRPKTEGKSKPKPPEASAPRESARRGGADSYRRRALLQRKKERAARALASSMPQDFVRQEQIALGITDIVPRIRQDQAPEWFASRTSPFVFLFFPPPLKSADCRKRSKVGHRGRGATAWTGWANA